VARSISRIVRRLVLALIVLAVAAGAFVAFGGVDAVRRAAFPLQYEEIIAKEASATGVDPYLIAAVVHAESGFDPEAVSGAGAVGLMQVKPSTARSIARITGMSGTYSKKTLKDPETNIRVGAAYLAYLLERYDGEVSFALAAYNGGLSNADVWADEAKASGKAFQDVIAFPETASYVEKVQVQRDVYRVLYPNVFGGVSR